MRTSVIKKDDPLNKQHLKRTSPKEWEKGIDNNSRSLEFCLNKIFIFLATCKYDFSEMITPFGFFVVPEVKRISCLLISLKKLFLKNFFLFSKIIMSILKFWSLLLNFSKFKLKI